MVCDNTNVDSDFQLLETLCLTIFRSWEGSYSDILWRRVGIWLPALVAYALVGITVDVA
jgi:hypothetical protein